MLYVQETHRSEEMNNPRINGMKLAAIRPHRKYGSGLFVRTSIDVTSSQITEVGDIEIFTIEVEKCTVTTIYKPPNSTFAFEKPALFNTKNKHIIIGDFNSHHTNWGYDETDSNDDQVEVWAESNRLTLIHDPKLPPSFNSGRWKKGFIPDIIFVSDTIAPQCTKEIGRPIPHTQHQPILCKVTAVIKLCDTPFLRRYNFQKADWNTFTKALDDAVTALEPVNGNYEVFTKLVKTISRKNIPRGCRIKHISGLTPELVVTLEQYTDKYEANSFDEDTIEKGEELMNLLTEVKRKRWCDLLTEVDMKRSSKKAWNLIKRLDNNPREKTKVSSITPNQIAHHLLMNGKNKMTKSRPCKPRIIQTENNEKILF